MNSQPQSKSSDLNVNVHIPINTSDVSQIAIRNTTTKRNLNAPKDRTTFTDPKG